MPQVSEYYGHGLTLSLQMLQVSEYFGRGLPSTKCPPIKLTKQKLLASLQGKASIIIFHCYEVSAMALSSIDAVKKMFSYEQTAYCSYAIHLMGPAEMHVYQCEEADGKISAWIGVSQKISPIRLSLDLSA